MITKTEFDAYCKVMNSGKYNMLTDMGSARLAAGLTSEKYFLILKNWPNLNRKFYGEFSPKKTITIGNSKTETWAPKKDSATKSIRKQRAKPKKLF
jgi:hypothetical protein